MNAYRKEAEQHGAKLVLNSEVIGGQMSGKCLLPAFCYKNNRCRCMQLPCVFCLQTSSLGCANCKLANAYCVHLSCSWLQFVWQKVCLWHIKCVTAHSPNGRPASIAQALCNHRHVYADVARFVHVGHVKSVQIKDRDTQQVSTVNTKMVVNAAGLYAQSVAHKLQGLPEDTIPEQYLARGHYCTMEGQQSWAKC